MWLDMELWGRARTGEGPLVGGSGPRYAGGRGPGPKVI